MQPPYSPISILFDSIVIDFPRRHLPSTLQLSTVSVLFFPLLPPRPEEAGQSLIHPRTYRTNRITL